MRASRPGSAPERVFEPQPPHQHDGAGDPPALPPPARRDHLLPQAGRARARPQRPAQGDVLHQLDVGESTGRQEDVAGDEDRLVAGGDAAQPRAQVHRTLDDAQHRMRAVEPHVEPAPCTASGAGGVADRPVPAGEEAACPRAGTATPGHSPPRRRRSFCRARPRGAWTSRSHRGRATRRVPSRLPPSATITSMPLPRRGCIGPSDCGIVPASSSTGTTSETAGRAERGPGGMRGGRAGSGTPCRTQFSAPLQLLPCPAVQPKQWSRTVIGRPSTSADVRSVTWVRGDPLSRIGNPSIWLKSQS